MTKQTQPNMYTKHACISGSPRPLPSRRTRLRITNYGQRLRLQLPNGPPPNIRTSNFPCYRAKHGRIRTLPRFSNTNLNLLKEFNRSLAQYLIDGSNPLSETKHVPHWLVSSASRAYLQEGLLPRPDGRQLIHPNLLLQA
jgi:hypothetical protein